MGGERETTVKSPSKGTTGAEVKVQDIRIHESGGQIHFHDDKKKIKCAIPTAKWFKIWQGITDNDRESYLYLDGINQSSLYVAIKNDNGKIVTELVLEQSKVDDTYTKLNNFTIG